MANSARLISYLAAGLVLWYILLSIASATLFPAKGRALPCNPAASHPIVSLAETHLRAELAAALKSSTSLALELQQLKSIKDAQGRALKALVDARAESIAGTSDYAAAATTTTTKATPGLAAPADELAMSSAVARAMRERELRIEQCSTSVGDVPLFDGSTVQPALLSAEQLAEGVVNVGAPGTLAPIATKLLAGRPVSIAVLGGSITFGHGTGTGWEMDAWPAILKKWLDRQFPVHSSYGDEGHAVTNSAAPAKGTSYFKDLVENLVGRHGVDLVVCEFSVNDRVTWDQAQGLTPPQVAADTEEVMMKLAGTGAAIVYLEAATWPERSWINGEDLHSPVLKYYRVPQLSWRQASGFATMPAAARERLMPDKVHLTIDGHFQLAQLLAGVVCKAALACKLGKCAAERFEKRPPVVLTQEALGSALAPPLTTLIADSRQEANFKPSSNSGWTWGTDDRLKEKFGWLAQKESGGEVIAFDVQVRLGVVTVGYLISYLQMGQARVVVTQRGVKQWTRAEDIACVGCQKGTSNVINGLYEPNWRHKDKGSVFASRRFVLDGCQPGLATVTIEHLPGNQLGCKFKLLSLISK